MKIGLIDVDSKLPNIALMKISAYHKAKGDKVGWHNPLFDKPDKAYASKIFTFTPDYEYWPECEIINGGSGYDLTIKLPNEIDMANPDYSIYPKCSYSIQIFSRGCIRNCPFCIVRQKEGYMHPVEPMELNPKGTHIEVLDNNFFANPEWRPAAELLLKWGQPVNFHGVDIRILTEEHAHYLNKIKQHKQIHIAWDNPKDDLMSYLKKITTWIKPYKLMCYVLVGYWSTPEEDLWRVEVLRDLKIAPFVMPFNKHDEYQRSFARWVNHKAIFKTVPWHKYNPGRIIQNDLHKMQNLPIV